MVASTAIAGRAAAQCVSEPPHTMGTWKTLPYQMPINPISASLIHTGKVYVVAGSENDAYNNSTGAQSYRALLWDPTGIDMSSFSVQNVNYDLFCSGSAQLPHGRMLTIGGSSTYAFLGENRATFFDPATQKFVQSQTMADGRWYGTATTMGDGRIFAFSGLNASNGATNNTWQIYDLSNAGAGWGAASTEPFAPPLFPRIFLSTDGRLFFSAHGAGTSTATAWFYDPSKAPASAWTSSVAKTRDRQYGSAVMLPLLPPGYTPTVMALGGGPNTQVTKTTETVDISAASPAWTAGPDMHAQRVQMNAVLLPSGQVLAAGGSLTNETPDVNGKKTDLYDPATGTMTQVATASFSRLYHSCAILLPDATVASFGSNPGDRGKYVTAIEIFTPPYLYDPFDNLITSGRPAINSVAPMLGYGANFSVNYTSSSPIGSAVLVRPGSTTHASDMDQRLIGLCGPSPQPPCTAAGGVLSLTTPPNGNIAPPGYYMLFILDSDGVPSKAQFIELATNTATPPAGVIASPASDVTINAGQRVSFDAMTANKYSWVFPGGSPATSTAKTPGQVTFSSPGTYIASLTVLDASNNSDPSPPTRKITVLPTSPDFKVFVSEASKTVVPGQSTTYTVTVTPLAGFTGTVTLSADSEGGFPTGVSSGGFSPATIAGSGTSTLTMNTTTAAIPYATSVSVHGSNGGTTHTASTTLIVNIAPPANLAATTSSGTVNLTWDPSIGANSYHVSRSRGGEFQTIACPSGTSYSDTGLTDGTTYHYAVTAIFTGGPDGGGASSLSAEILATPPCPLPTYIGTLSAAKDGTGATVWSWTSGGATVFDLVRGDLGTLVSTSGDFGAAIDALPAGQACLANNTTSLSLTDPYGDPSPGSGVFTLLRPVTTACPAEGTLDDGSGSQTGSRDAEAASSTNSCP